MVLSIAVLSVQIGQRGRPGARRWPIWTEQRYL